MISLTDKKIAELELKANDIRVSIIESLSEAGSGHTAGSLGMADVFTTLYFAVMNHDPKNPDKEDRDRLILSNGHIAPVLYATMAHAGYFPVKELMTLRKFGSRLQGHPHRTALPGLETSSGPLGSGLSQAVGMAIAEEIDFGETSNKFFYCLLGDGELNEGQNWEAIMLAGKKRLHNLVAVIDRNNIQIDGNTEDILPLEPLREKFLAFNWHVIEMDGHNIRGMYQAFLDAQSISEKPIVIIAHTIPSKGVRSFQRDYRWHGAPPGKGPEDLVKKDKQREVALKELKEVRGEIEEKIKNLNKK